MALFDVDKSSDDRGNPAVNKHDQVIAEAVMARGTFANQYNVGTPGNIGPKITVNNSQILTYDGETNRLLITPTDAKLSQPGDDVLNPKLPYIWDASQNMFKIALSSTTTLVPPASWTSGTVITATIPLPPGVTGTPACQVFVSNPSIFGSYTGGNGLTNLPCTTYAIIGGTGGVAYFYQQARIDSTNLYIDLINMSGGTISGYNIYTWSYRYYILQETAS